MSNLYNDLTQFLDKHDHTKLLDTEMKTDQLNLGKIFMLQNPHATWTKLLAAKTVFAVLLSNATLFPCCLDRIARGGN